MMPYEVGDRVVITSDPDLFFKNWGLQKGDIGTVVKSVTFINVSHKPQASVKVKFDRDLLRDTFDKKNELTPDTRTIAPVGLYALQHRAKLAEHRGHLTLT